MLLAQRSGRSSSANEPLRLHHRRQLHEGHDRLRSGHALRGWRRLQLRGACREARGPRRSPPSRGAPRGRRRHRAAHRTPASTSLPTTRRARHSCGSSTRPPTSTSASCPSRASRIRSKPRHLEGLVGPHLPDHRLDPRRGELRDGARDEGTLGTPRARRAGLRAHRVARKAGCATRPGRSAIPCSA